MSEEPVVLVDARNVVRSRWPNIEDERFLDLTRRWAEAEGARVVAVFDGRAPNAGAGVHELDERTTVVGTGSESADDWIVDHVSPRAGAGARPWLVSSDRSLRERVGDRVERTIGGGSFAARLEALELTPASGGEER